MRREEQVRTTKMDMLGVNAAVAGGDVLGSWSARKQPQIRMVKKDILGLGRGSRAGEMLDEKRALEIGDDGWEPPVGERRTCHLQAGPTHQSSTSASESTTACQRGKTA